MGQRLLRLLAIGQVPAGGSVEASIRQRHGRLVRESFGQTGVLGRGLVVEPEGPLDLTFVNDSATRRSPDRERAG